MKSKVHGSVGTMSKWLKMLIFSTLSCSSTHCCAFDSIFFGDLSFFFFFFLFFFLFLFCFFPHITTDLAQVE